MQATGIQIDGQTLRTAVVRRKGRNWQIVDLNSWAVLPPKQLEKSTPPSGRFFGLFGNGSSCKSDLHSTNVTKGGSFSQQDFKAKKNFAPVLVSGLHSNDLLIRSRTFTPAKSRKLRQALILQVEAQLHLKAEDVITVSSVEFREKRATTYSTTKSALNSHLESYHSFQIDPEYVGAVPAALKTFVHWKDSETSSYFIIDIGKTVTNCVWVENGLLQKAHAISCGMQQLQHSFRAEQNKTDWAENDPIDYSLVKTDSSAFAEEARFFRREVAKQLCSFQQQRPLFFSGEADEGTQEFLLETLREFIQEEKKLNSSAEELRYAIGIGLAMDYLANNKQPVQFRIGQAISSKSWHRLGCSSAWLLGSALLVSLIAYETGIWWMDQREKEIAQNLEAWTLEKDPSLRLELFSAGRETQDLVNQWIRLIEKNSKDYRFVMRAPKVAYFLNWLTRHPLIESFHSTPDPILFEQIHYQLVSLPRLESMEDPYLVKVELDFKVNSPQHARKFHEMLLQETDKVDSSREIEWEVLPDHYRTSFYLKNEQTP